MKRLLLPLIIASSLTSGAYNALAGIVVEIDVTNNAAVTITAIANNSLINADADVNFNRGITLENFFTVNQTILAAGARAVAGNLTARGTTSAYNELVTFDWDANTGTVETGNDLSVYNNAAANGDDQNFVTTAAPFTGVATVDFSANAAALPAVGASGNLNVGWQSAHGGAIGTWVAVPEPETYGLMTGLGALALGVVRKRRIQHQAG